MLTWIPTSFTGLFIQSSVRAIFVSRLELTKDGHISKDSQLPKCDDGRMKLLSYSYKFVCGDNKCPNAPDEQLSVLAEAVIHSMCSLKRKCVHQESSLITIPGNMKAFLNISYTCVGKPFLLQFRNFV